MKYLYLIFFIQATSCLAQSSADTIFTYNKKIVARVREIGPQEISYSLPNEDVVYKMYRRAVLSITFSNGRKEVFNEEKNFEPLKRSDDWKKVTLTSIPEETNGMIRIDMVSVKASGATVYSSVTGTQDRAFQKLKQAAAILGGNVVLINDQSVEGNIYGERTTRTQLTGTIYRSMPMDTTGLFKCIVNHTFATSERKTLAVNSSAPFTTLISSKRLQSRNLKSFEYQDGILYWNANLNEAVSKFIVTYYSVSKLIIAYHSKSRFVEITLVRVAD